MYFQDRLTKRKSIVRRIIGYYKKVNPVHDLCYRRHHWGSLWDVGFVPSIAVIDYKSRREALTENSKFVYPEERREIRNLKTRKYRNRAGTIETSAVRRLKALCNAYLKNNSPQCLVINGEEDLMVLPAILVAPLSSLVLYGQYDLGVVAVKVTEEKKIEVWEVVKNLIYFSLSLDCLSCEGRNPVYKYN